MTNVTQADQRRLLELQATDTTIRQLRYRRANLPDQQTLDEATSLLERITADHLAAADELVAVDRKVKRLETEVNTVDARRKSEEARMYSGVIASEREVKALRKELSTLRNRKRDLEDELLEVMERQEELHATIATLETRAAELRTEVGPLQTARDAAAGDIDRELAEKERARGELAQQLAEGLIRRYNELRARKDGVAVVELRDGTCQGCFLELTPGEMEEGHEMGVLGLARCVQCGRLLVEPVRG